MIIAVDEAIPYWQEALSPFGELRPYQGTSLRGRQLRDADALVVRSVTPVNAELLHGSRVRFVGTASVGMDHLDLHYLDSHGIACANAAGCNANAVSEYVTAALLLVAERRGWDLGKKSVAIIGVGNVGSQVARKTAALGMEVHRCDPPLRETTGDSRYRDLADVVGCDVLSLHVPLTRSGPHATYHMVDRGVLSQLRPAQFLLNTSRGSVVDGAALKETLLAGRIQGAVLDVWEGEPRIDYSLLDTVDLGTAHVAGFSLDGKIRATEMMVEALSRYTGEPVTWDSSPFYPGVRQFCTAAGDTGPAAIGSLVRQAYDIARDDSLLRRLASLPPDDAAAEFERLRTGYDLRPEFHHYRAELPAGVDPPVELIRTIGFQTSRG